MNAKILKTTIDSFQSNFNLEESKSFQMDVRLEASIKQPQNPKDNTALLTFNTQISSNDDSVSLNMESAIIFEFDEIPSDYQLVAKDICIPMAQKEILGRIDNILENLGYPEIKFSSDVLDSLE